MNRLRIAAWGLAATILGLTALSDLIDRPRLWCERGAEPRVPGTIKAGRIGWIDQIGEFHPISGQPDEAQWSCLPADNHHYPVDPI